MKALPAGYVELRGVAVHVARLRRYTTDIHRFMQYLPFVEDLESLGAATPAWRARLRQMKRDEIKGVQVTSRELVQFYYAESASLLEGDDPDVA